MSPEGHDPHQRHAGYDEARNADASLRPAWDVFGRLLDSSPDQLNARRDLLRRNVDELGITYNVYSDSQGIERPWQLDLLPLVIGASEWPALERGLIQRTRLFNALYRDLYGPKTLMEAGVLPPALVYANPAFLRACDGLGDAAPYPIALHGVNLARRPDGTWCVLSDRTQSPSGLGYALANRIVLSRTLPDEFRNSQTRRHAGFFMALRETLLSLAPRGTDSPSIALLTPGPYNETYFEHSFLARYLGLPLVEGGDLTLREQRVFIKTLEGLRPLDLLFRRVDDTFADPLELRPDSCLGVPGLVDAIRAGRVGFLNAIGCAWLESPALLPFLPAACRHLLGEELLLPSVQTWWCGDPESRAHTFLGLDSLVIKRTGTDLRRPHRFGSRLSAQERSRLLDELAFSPGDIVAQERLPLSHAPTLTDAGLGSRPVIFRTFVCSGPAGSHVLPGGLARVSNSSHGMIISMQGGAVSKDTWIRSDEPVIAQSLLRPATQVIRLERAPAEVPSRVADNLFWLGRYAERLEDSCRILRCLLTRLTSENGTEETPELAALIDTLVKLDLFPDSLLTRRSLAAVERESVQLIFHSHRLGTVKEIHSRLQSLAFSLRDRFSADTQRILGRLQYGLRSKNQSAPVGEGLDVLNHLILHLAAFSGLEMENMTRGHAWRFLDMGRRLERAINVVTLLQTGLVSREAHGSAVLGPILEIGDSSMTYRRRYFGHPEWPTVVDLLIADDGNPRSLAFQLGALLEHVNRLPDANPRSDQSSREARLLLDIRESLQNLNIAELTEGDLPTDVDPLPLALGRIAADMRTVSDAITQRFFAHPTDHSA